MKFNEAHAMNKDLRKQIDALNQERIVFEGIYRKMEKQLVDRKKAMAAIIEASNKAYEARDSAQMEIAAIQQSMSREKQEFEEAVVALNRYDLGFCFEQSVYVLSILVLPFANHLETFHACGLLYMQL